MALTGKIETEIEIQAAAPKFYNIFRNHYHLLPSISGTVQQAQLQQGDSWVIPGSVKHWNYTLDGKPENSKEKIESIDDENKKITYSIYDGAVTERFKYLKAILEVNVKVEGGLVKWTYEYEKVNDNIAAPQDFFKLSDKVTKDIDAHLLKG